MDDDTKVRLVSLIKKLNHRAKLLETSYGKVDVKQIVNTGMFDLAVAQSGYGWLQDLHEMTVREVRHPAKPSPSVTSQARLSPFFQQFQSY